MRLRVPLAGVLTILLLPIALISAPHYAPWSDVVNLGPAVNTSSNDTTPTLSKDGTSLYFTSNRPCGALDVVLDLNIWVARRTEEGEWIEPQCLAINVDGFEDSAAALSRDQHWMFFTSDRPGSVGSPGFNGRDIWVSWRANVHDANGWNDPVHAGTGANTAFAEAGPSYFEDTDTGVPQLFFTSNRDAANGFNIFVADVLGDGQLGDARPVAELNSPFVDARPSIRHDGLEIFFFRGSGAFDIYVATRADVASPWSPPVRLDGPVSTAFNDQQPGIAADRETLFFVSNRPGGWGNLDIWMATRSKMQKR